MYEETVHVEKATHLQHTQDLCCSVGMDGMAHSCIMDGRVDASKDILGISKHFQAWRELAKVKQENKQTNRDRTYLLKLRCILQAK